MSDFGTKTGLKERTTNYVRESGENPRKRLGGWGTGVAAFAVLAAIGGGVRGCAENITDLQEGGLTEVAKGNARALKNLFVAQDIERPDIDVSMGLDVDRSARQTDPICDDVEPHTIVFGDRIYNLVRDSNIGTLTTQSAIESVVFDEFTAANPGINPNSIEIGTEVLVRTGCVE